MLFPRNFVIVTDPEAGFGPVFIAKCDFRDTHFKTELRTALKPMESLIRSIVEWEGENVKVTRSTTGSQVRQEGNDSPAE
jgi:hypothetical protein